MSLLFDKAFELVVMSEVGTHADGGYTNNPLDPGGETKWGISKRAYPHLDIPNLTKDDSKGLYFKDYWIPAGCEQQPWSVAYPLFDCAVNQGLGRAIEIKKKAPEGAGWLFDFLARRAMAYAEAKSYASFGHGWLVRLFRVQASAIQAP